ncbi:hypothetical protein NDU88_003616 [Pleurodeles waltl]|uniref:Uncharacterized protein n=1 Tax=Pleurodeles waltl TaxID=8319 RepID=A0AAV7MZ28_PLEWA|nr:hypothetical protein NDU88_003616 [Pleurodeles waltl]
MTASPIQPSGAAVRAGVPHYSFLMNHALVWEPLSSQKSGPFRLPFSPLSCRADVNTPAPRSQRLRSPGHYLLKGPMFISAATNVVLVLSQTVNNNDQFHI